MADISITAANVIPAANADKEQGIAGETIAAGKVVYKDLTTGKYQLADNNAGAEAARKPRGVALNSASLDQPLMIMKSGDVTIGGTLTAGTTYYLSDTPGGICPLADVGSAEYACIVGIAKSTTVLALGIQYSGVAL